MSEQGATQQIDSILLPFLQTADEEESKNLLEEIVFKHADNVIKAVIGSEMQISLDRVGQFNWNSYQIEDAKDAYGEIVEKLVERLWELKSDSGGELITDFRNYVGRMAKNACFDFLRQKYPQRCKLKNRLRYLLIHNEDFALWESKTEELICGLDSWNKIGSVAVSTNVLSRFELSFPGARSMDLTDLINGIFKQIGAPIRLEDLVSIIADLLGIKDQAIPRSLYVKPIGPDLTERAERQSYLKRLWAEIFKLPLRQRIALLLNLRGESGFGIELFIHIGLTSIRGMAELLEIPIEQFVGLWNELPLEDEAIAARLGVTRQQVINLRSVARNRLARKMEDL